GEFRSDARRADATDDQTAFNAGLFIFEDVGHGDHVTFHALHFGDFHDLARAVAQTFLMGDEVNRAGDLLADSADGQVHARHQAHDFKTGDRVARAVRVRRRQRAVVTGVHRLKHVERFTGAAFADDDAVGAHTERVDDQVLNGDCALAFNVRRAA